MDQVKTRAMIEEAIAWGTGDPLVAKLVDSIERPSNNITGTSVSGSAWIEEYR